MFSDVGTVTAIMYKVPHPFRSYAYLHLEEWRIVNTAVITKQGTKMEIHT